MTKTVAIMSPGDMGHGVGRDLRARGFRVLSCVEGRSERSHSLALQAGIELVRDIDELVSAADIVLSILPPSAALELAREVAGACRNTGARPVFADCNAIAPDTVREVERSLEGLVSAFIDAGIIGVAPGKSELPTRFYCSGADVSGLVALDGGGMRICPLGEEIGRASAMKMVYAAVTKGTMTLHATALMAAERYGLSDAYHAELAESQPAVWAAMNRRVPRLPLDAGRWVGEMHEIAQALSAVGLPPDFHRAAAEVFSILDRTPIAKETRETVDESRTLGQALEIFVSALTAEAT